MVRLGLVVVLIALCSAPVDARPMGLDAVGAAASLAIVDSRIEVTVRRPILETVVVQRFRNTSGHATEATYIFPLPADAASSALAIQIGGRTVRGAIDGREEAQRRYEAAVAAAGRTINRDTRDRAPVSLEEAIMVAGSARRLRLTAALGAGLVFDHGTRGLAALAARIEINPPTALGFEAALWLSDGSDTEGRALFTVARRGLALELGLGAGVQFGIGAGVATALRLRINLPAPWVTGYLRYDAAVLVTRPSLEAEPSLANLLPHVFERFRQDRTGPTLRRSGLGLGLPIVQQLLELHGGTIHADSLGRDQGSTFTVRLPFDVLGRSATS